MNKKEIKSIAINTGGGDAPGLNAVIRAVVLSSFNRGWKCYGIREGYNGILQPDEYPDGGIVELTPDSVRGITHLGGTILGTTNRGNPLNYPLKQPDGSVKEVNRIDEIIQAFNERGIDALIAIGGDGSLHIAHEISLRGLRVIGVPKTIDNDLERTVITFGFDTAVSFASNCIDRLHSTAEAHRRIMVVEVMGRYAGWIALHTGVSGTADAILIPEIPYDLEKVAEKIIEREKLGKHFSMVVVAEGAKPKGGTVSVLGEKEVGRAERLGGIGERVARELEILTGKEARAVVLGHLLRGGSPTNFDRVLSLRFGAAAVRGLAEGRSDCMAALDPPYVKFVPLSQVAKRMKLVPLDSDIILTARELGITFGE